MSIIMICVHVGVPAGILASCAGTTDLSLIIVLVVLWGLALGFYLATACRDPGLVPRSAEPNSAAARWSAHADSYIEPNAAWATEGNVIVKGYDHMCVWTGRACAGVS